MQAGYRYDRNVDKKFLKAKLKVRKLDKAALGLYDTIEEDTFSATVEKDKAKPIKADMNTQTDGTSTGTSTVTSTITSRTPLDYVNTNQNELVRTVLQNVNNPNSINSDAKARATPVDPKMAQQMQNAGVLAAELRMRLNQLNTGKKLSEMRQKTAAKASSVGSPVINNTPTVETTQIASNIRPAISRELPPLEVIDTSSKVSSRVSSPSSTVATDVLSSIANPQSTVADNDVANLEEIKGTPGRKPRSEKLSRDRLFRNFDKHINDTNKTELRKNMVDILKGTPIIEDFIKRKKLELQVLANFKDDVPKNESTQDVPFMHQIKDKILITTDKIVEPYIKDLQRYELGLGGSGMKKRLTLATRRPRKKLNESLPMNAVLLNQLDKGHLSIVTKKGNQILSQKNISSSFKKIVQDVLKTGTFDPNDYRLADDKEIPALNRFIIESDALIPPNTPYKSTDDHVKDVKNRYNILVGELASGNTGKLIRDEMAKILKEMVRLRQITYKSYKEKSKALQDYA